MRGRVRFGAAAMGQDTKKPGLEAGTTPPGRVVTDKSGRTVWQWTEEENTGSTSVLLKFLDNEALSLEPTQAVPIPAAAPLRATGGASTESTSVALRRLDAGQLDLEPTWTAPVPESLRGTPRKRASAWDRAADGSEKRPEACRDPAGGFDPYDHS